MKPTAPPTVRVRRPNLSRVVRLVIRDVARQIPEFAHVRAERILVVAGEARRRSRATIRPLRSAVTGGRGRPKVRFRGRDIRYLLTLRPLFFRDSTVEERIATVLHELFHVSPTFDGTLAPSRRHAALPPPAFDALLGPLVGRYRELCPESLLRQLAFDGEALVRQWLEKPPVRLKPGRSGRRLYDEAQTFLGPVRMRTRRRR
jgi:predicted metallopeptidase